MNPVKIFVQTLDTTLPVFALVFIGVAMRRAGWIDDRFVSVASKIVFKGSLPTLIFVSIVGADLSKAIRPGMIFYFGVVSLAGFVLIWLWAIRRVPKPQRGVYVQGAFRGNCGIVGLALAQNMYGNFGLSAGSVLVGEAVLLYNIFAVIVLTWYQPDQSADWRNIGRSVITNPLIVASLASIAITASGVQIPKWLMITGNYFAQLTLPLALICIGGALSVRALYEARGIAFSASMIKLMILPGAAVTIGWLIGFPQRELGLMFIYFACPSAAASFIMVEAMGGDARLAANIVALTTLISSASMTAGVFILRLVGII